MNQKAMGEKVRDLRRKLGYTTVTLARKMKMSQAQISRLENGLQGFRSHTLIKMSKVLGVAPVYFFLDDDSVATSTLVEELDAQGLTASRRLRKALANPVFLKFAEKCARKCGIHRKTLSRMDGMIDKL